MNNKDHAALTTIRLKQIRSKQTDKLSEEKLKDVLKSYRSYHEVHHIDENKQVYMDRGEFENLQNT